MSGVNAYPVLPLRDIVVFPHMIVPLFVGREKSVRALEEVTNGDGRILLAAQHEAAVDDPGPDDIYTVGAIGSILQLLKLPDGTVKVLVEGGERARITGFTEQALKYLVNYRWPGNIRELQNVIERLVALEKGDQITHKSLPFDILISVEERIDGEGVGRTGVVDHDRHGVLFSRG